MNAPRGVLFISGSAASATLRYRVRQAEEELRDAGVRTAAVHVTDRRAALLADAADVVVLYRCPAGAELVALLDRLRSRPVPPLVTYDIDDLVFREGHLHDLPFLASLDRRQRAIFERDVRGREQLVPTVDLVTGSTPEVLADLSVLTDAPQALLPNGVGREQLRRSDTALRRRRPDDAFRIGYFSGSATHDADWLEVEQVLVDVLRARPDAELWLVGKLGSSPGLDPVRERVRVLPYVDWTELPPLLRAVDVTLAPLAPSPFTEAKSAIKWLEAALVETPTVATPTGPFRSVIEHGRTGYLAATPAQWHDALMTLATDPHHRAKLGAAARTSALDTFGPHVQRRRLLEALSSRPEAGRPPNAAGQGLPVSGPELPQTWRLAPVRLEPYPFAPELTARLLRPRWSRRPAAVALAGAGVVGGVVRRGRRAALSRVGSRPGAEPSRGPAPRQGEK